jgi:hypothetical protein
MGAGCGVFIIPRKRKKRIPINQPRRHQEILFPVQSAALHRQHADPFGSFLRRILQAKRAEAFEVMRLIADP